MEEENHHEWLVLSRVKENALGFGAAAVQPVLLYQPAVLGTLSANSCKEKKRLLVKLGEGWLHPQPVGIPPPSLLRAQGLLTMPAEDSPPHTFIWKL